MPKRWLIIFGIVFLVLFVSGVLFWQFWPLSKYEVLSPLAVVKQKDTQLNQYRFLTLAERKYEPSLIELVGMIGSEEEYKAYEFAFDVDGVRITGQANLPTGYQQRENPVVVLVRGFVDPSVYVTGMGTKNAAGFFAKNGFLTFAPDFAGFGDSGPADEDGFAARLKKPVTVLTLLESVKALEYVDEKNIFFWGHSNGGQILLSVLEISQLEIPTTLWAPVSKSFPYSVLYYTDEYDDQGKSLRKALAVFEEDYDVDDYSIYEFWDRIRAPIQLHQGGKDDAVPMEWSDELAATLSLLAESTESGKLSIEYYRYPAADHNLRPDWNMVVSRDLEFFREHMRAVE